jgi:hypothetical protein
MAFMIFPFTLVSSAYVPVATMPGWMRGFANNQPITPMVNAVRALMLRPQAQAVLSHAAGYYVVRSLLWSVALTCCPRRLPWPGTAAADAHRQTTAEPPALDRGLASNAPC